MYKSKEKKKKYAKKHYKRNKIIYKQRARNHNIEARIRNRKYVDDFLTNHPCVDCGNSNIIVLEFDHVRGTKLRNIADAIRGCWSIKKIQSEIDKCDVRCANCHRIATYNRRRPLGGSNPPLAT